MTWSIVAQDPASGSIGIASASRAFAVGKQVPFIESRVGAIATQALVNPLYGRRGLALFREGVSATDALRLLIEPDTGRSHRQLHILDSKGNFAAFTGEDCIDWSGHLVGKTCSVAGNMLTGPKVLEATLRSFEASTKSNFPVRLLDAMRAGEAEGGDKRGKQSASVIIYSTEEYSDLELRADDHPDPLAELERLERISRDRWMYFRMYIPRRDNPIGETDRAVIDAGVKAAIAQARRAGND